MLVSRTDKDRPYRIKCLDETLDREEQHDHRPTYMTCITHTEPSERYARVESDDGSYRGFQLVPYDKPVGFKVAVHHPCDIEQNSPSNHWRWRQAWQTPRCEYSLPFHEARWHKAVPGWYRAHRYHNPMRRETRDVLRNAARDYNTYGETDIITDDRQGRHSCHYDWW